MTEEEYNEALKELGVVLLDVDYAKLKTTLDVAKIVIHLNKINERIVLEDNDFYQKENEELKAQIEKMKCCQNCKHHSFWGDELKCNFLSYDEELECLKNKHKWELAE